MNDTPRRTRAAGSLVFEFLVIVLGVLAALAVDEWRDGRARAERERSFLEALAVNLARDSAEITSFGRAHTRRVDAAHVILMAAGHPLADTARARQGTEDGLTPARALGVVGLGNHLEPAFATFNGMIAAGAPIVSDPELHHAILDYYAELEDAMSYNSLVDTDAHEYRGLVQRYGYTPSDRDAIDPAALLADPTILAMVRSLRLRAFGAAYTAEGALARTLELRKRVIAELER